MSINTFVYPHPINAFIIQQLGVTVDQFCELHGFVQSTVAMWIARNRRVENLPGNFIYCLSLSANRSMDFVYAELLKFQEEYDIHVKRNRRTKKVLK
jgi:uncharacterized membrane protein YheB (UPF0754 family)